MKRITTICLLIVSATSLFAQGRIDQEIADRYQKEAGDHAALYYAPIENPFSQARWINHPYWEQLDCVEGEVCFDRVVYKKVMMRFNIATQRLIVAMPNSKILVTPDMAKVDYFVIFGKRFEEKDGRFMCVEYRSGNLTLWHEKVKMKGTDVQKDNRSYSSYNEIDRFYVVDGQTEFQIKKAKDIAKHYPIYKKMILKHIKNSYIQDKYELMAETLEYLTSIK